MPRIPRERAPTALGKYRTVSFSKEVDSALVEFAEENTGGNLAEALRLLVTNGLKTPPDVTAYKVAYRAGMRDVKAAIAQALNEKWREG